MSGKELAATAALAEQQAGAITLAQMYEAGLTDSQVRWWLKRMRILPTAARGVFRMPGTEPTWRQSLWVAVLAGPVGTVVSHLSAASLWGLLPPPEVPHVSVGRNASGRFSGAAVHHAVVESADRCRLDRVPVTKVARTIVDCAALLGREELDAMVDAAFGRGLCSYRRVRAAQGRAGRVRGGDRLEEALAPYAAGAQPGSMKEAHLLRMFRRWGLPAPVTQHVIRDGNGRFIAKVDFAWPPWRVGLEYDGDEFHSPRRWAHDDRRLADIEAVQWRIEESDRGDFRPSATRLPNLLRKLLPPLP